MSYTGSTIKFKKSIRGFNWNISQPDPRLVLTLSQKLDIPDILASVIVNRGVSSLDDAVHYLEPKIKDILPDPFQLKDMDKAANRLADAIINGEKVAVFGDYDVDGATSTALLRRFFRDLGRELTVYIPNRMLEGYGPNIEALRKLHAAGNNLIITVDCGVVSNEPLKLAKEDGIEIIILDHHLSTETLPEAVAIVNPNRFDEDFPIKSIAAVGISFFAIVAIRSKLREKGWFNDKKEIDLLKYLDLVALGTVCDVMQLVGVNRAFVHQGLKLIGARKNVGLSVLSDVAKIKNTPQSYHLGFIFGPRINAGGRVGEGMLGTDLLSTDSPEEAYKIALKLEKLNDERRSIEALVIEDALKSIEDNKLYNNPFILVSGHNWHQGILGIIASRIKEKYNKPAGVVSIVGGIGKGSARSISGIDLGSLLAAAKGIGLLTQGGGHAMAGGFSIEIEKLDDFYAFINQQLQGKELEYAKAKEFKVDAALSISAANGKLIKLIERAAPFGSANPQPKFALTNVNVNSVRLVGSQHMMVIVSDRKSDSNTTLKCMLFKAVDTDLGRTISNSIGKDITLFGGLQLNFNDHEKADFIIEDMCFND